MCFTEFIGYTCGHASAPVKRLCPLTTQLYNNPCCDRNAVRPMLATTFCPACARILHGRWVNILELEHRFMHERGACSCAARFPHLQQPRVIEHHVEGDSSVDHHDQHEQSQHQAQAYNATDFKHYEHDNAENDTSGSVTPTPTRSQVFSAHVPGSGALSPTGSQLSGSAAPFVPSHEHGGAQAIAPQHHGSMSADHAASSANVAPVPYITNAAVAHGPSSSLSSLTAAEEGGYRGRSSGRGKGKQRRNNRKARDSPENRTDPHRQQAVYDQHQPQQEHQPQVHSHKQHQHQQPPLAPLFQEHHDSRTQKPVVSVRMISLYGAEWVQDHAPLHRDGRCQCAVRFDRYESPDMPSVPADGGVAAAYPPIDTLYDYEKHYNASSPSAARQLGADQNPMAATMPHVTTAGGHPARWACSPAQQEHNTGNVDQGHPHQFGDSRGNGMDISDGLPPVDYITGGDKTAPPMHAAVSEHPIDMQTAWYDQSGVPIAGLPIGAGPEGDSHMPPFDQCELQYVTPPRHAHGNPH
ncbi:hypothetical protein GGR52DRAFT_385412 [Hypoxylon sp. FL1284]|nr:hypothetical protein GGR52DRAFT_385412 [Hypoxylon sp. FL1284]